MIRWILAAFSHKETRSAYQITRDTDDETRNGHVAHPRLSIPLKADLEPASKRVLLALLASPKTPQEVSRIYGIPVALVWNKVRKLEELGLVREVLCFIDSAGLLRRYFEASLPVDEAEDELVVETRV